MTTPWQDPQQGQQGRAQSPQQPYAGQPQQPQAPYPGALAQPPYGAAPQQPQVMGTPQPFTMPPQLTGGVAQTSNSLGALFEFGFQRYATPSLVKVVYLLTVIMCGGSWILMTLTSLVGGSAIAAYSSSAMVPGLLMLFFGWIPALLAIAFVRFTLEYYIVNIRTNEKINAIYDRLNRT